MAGISFPQDFEASLLKQKLQLSRNQLSQINLTLNQLNAKLKKTKSRASIVSIKREIAKQQKGAELTRKYIADLEKQLAKLEGPAPIAPAPRVAAAPSAEKKCNLILGGGLGGGAAALNLEYFLPLASDLDLGIGTGYGVGQDYLLVMAQGEGVIKINSSYFVGLSVDLVNYSTKVLDIPGLPKTTNSGNHIGAGAFAGMKFGDWLVKVGYSSALGILASGGYRLNI